MFVQRAAKKPPPPSFWKDWKRKVRSVLFMPLQRVRHLASCCLLVQTQNMYPTGIDHSSGCTSTIDDSDLANAIHLKDAASILAAKQKSMLFRDSSTPGEVLAMRRLHLDKLRQEQKAKAASIEAARVDAAALPVTIGGIESLIESELAAHDAAVKAAPPPKKKIYLPQCPPKIKNSEAISLVRDMVGLKPNQSFGDLLNKRGLKIKL